MRVAALIIAKCVRVMPAQHFEHLLPLSQVDFRDAARARLPVRDHGLPIRVQVVMSIGAAGGHVISLGIPCAVRRAPTTKASCVIAANTTVETDSLAIPAPKLMLVPFVCGLARDWSTLLIRNIQQPH